MEGEKGAVQVPMGQRCLLADQQEIKAVLQIQSQDYQGQGCLC